jgi:uncharacterized tellurite resistance protein B-like protein
MSLLGFLGLKREEQTNDIGDTETVRRVVRELEAMDPEKARYIAAFAYILSRVANADLEISSVETQKMEEIIEKFGNLPSGQATLVVQIAKSQNRLLGPTEDFLVTREFKKISTLQQRQELLDCMFAVSAADDSISSAEEAQIRQISSELGFTHSDYITARLRYSDKREVLKPFRKQ